MKIKEFIREQSKAFWWVVACGIIGTSSVSISLIRYFWVLAMEHEHITAVYRNAQNTLDRIERNTDEIYTELRDNDRRTEEINVMVHEHDVKLPQLEEGIKELKVEVAKLELEVNYLKSKK